MPSFARASFGIRGTYIAVVCRSVAAIFWFGTQTYQGGQAVNVMLGAIWPSFKTFPNHLPESAHVTSALLLCFFIFYIIQLPLLYIHISKLRYLFMVKVSSPPISALAPSPVPNAGLTNDTLASIYRLCSCPSSGSSCSHGPSLRRTALGQSFRSQVDLRVPTPWPHSSSALLLQPSHLKRLLHSTSVTLRVTQRTRGPSSGPTFSPYPFFSPSAPSSESWSRQQRRSSMERPPGTLCRFLN